MIWMTVFAASSDFHFITFIPYFAKVQLHAGESGLGWLLACSGFGVGAGRDDHRRLRVIRHRGRVVTICGVFFFAAIIGFSYSQIFWVSQCLAFLEGFNGILMISCFNVSIQHLSSDAMRGRMMSIYATRFLGLPPLGCLLAGEFSRHIHYGPCAGDDGWRWRESFLLGFFYLRSRCGSWIDGWFVRRLERLPTTVKGWDGDEVAGFVRSHPCAMRLAQGWGTQIEG